MSREEFNYMSKCLLDTLENVGNARSIKEVYFQKGVIRTLEDLLYRFSDDYMIDELNRKVINVKTDF